MEIAARVAVIRFTGNREIRRLRGRGEREKAAFNKAAAVFWSHCGTERSSRDICISLRGTRWNLLGRRRGECLRGRVTTNEVENATRIDKVTDEERWWEKKWSL